MTLTCSSRIWTTTSRKSQKCSSKNVCWDWMRGDFASRSKAKAKPQRRFSTGTILVEERTWTDVEPGEYSISGHAVSKKLIHLLRHGNLPSENDGAIEFWKNRQSSETFLVLSSLVWRKVEESMARGGGNKKRYQYCTDSSRVILYLRAFQSHSGRSLIDPTLQDNVISCRMCNQFTFHHQFGIDTVRSKFKQQTHCLLPACRSHEQEPQGSWYDQLEWRNIRIRCIGFDINLALKKRLKFYHTRSNAIIFHETLPTYCIPKVVRMETGEVIYEKVYASPRPLPGNMTGWKNCVRKLLDNQMEKLSYNPKVQSSQTNPNQDHERTVKPVASQHVPLMTENFNVEDGTNYDRTGQTRCVLKTSRFVLNVQRGGHWLQNILIATFCCEISW